MVIGSSNLDRAIGNYHIVAELARGAFGSVYMAKHIIFSDRPVVAIKLLHTHLSSSQERDRFFQEARLLEMLKHPYILPIIDAGIHEGFPYLVVEYASNGSLRDRIQRHSHEPFTLEEAINILSQIGQALHYAHQQHIIHRDLKPENILFNVKGEALLADFGIATVLATESVKYSTIIGTPTYMAPEQFRGIVSRESDQYSLGCIAYELFTLSKPFTAPDFVALMFKHVTESPTPPKQLNPQLPIHIEYAILKAMAKERSNRYAEVSAFIKALSGTKEQWLEEGNAHCTANRNAQALVAFKQAILLDPNDAITYNLKGRVLHKLWKNKEALEALEHAIQLDPNYAEAYGNKGAVLHSLGREQEALATYDRAIQLDPSNFGLSVGKAILLNDLGWFEEAAPIFQQATRMHPNDVDTWATTWEVLRNAGKYDEAQLAYERIKQLGGHSLIAAYEYDYAETAQSWFEGDDERGNDDIDE